MKKKVFGNKKRALQDSYNKTGVTSSGKTKMCAGVRVGLQTAK